MNFCFIISKIHNSYFVYFVYLGSHSKGRFLTAHPRLAHALGAAQVDDVQDARRISPRLRVGDLQEWHDSLREPIGHLLVFACGASWPLPRDSDSREPLNK